MCHVQTLLKIYNMWEFNTGKPEIEEVNNPNNEELRRLRTTRCIHENKGSDLRGDLLRMVILVLT